MYTRQIYEFLPQKGVTGEPYTDSILLIRQSIKKILALNFFSQIITVIVDRCENARLVQLGEELVEDESNCKITGKIRGTNQ